MISSFKKLFYLLDKRTRRQFLLLFGLMLIGAILETTGIGLIVPFISIIANPEVIETNQWLNKLKNILGVDNPKDFLIYMSVGLVAFFIIKNTFLGMMNYLQLRFVFSKRSLMGRKLLSLYLNSPYTFHLKRNTAELLRNIELAAGKVFAFVQALLKFCTELCVVSGVVVLLILVDPIIFICSVILLGAISGIFYKIVHKYSRAWGETLQSSQKKVHQSVLESLGAIKEVKVSGRESFFSKKYFLNMMDNARAQWMHSTLNVLPLLILEVIAVGSIVFIIILVQIQERSINTLLPMLSLFAMAIIRLMPAISRIVSSLQQFRFYSPAVDIIYEDFIWFNTVMPSTPSIKAQVELFSFKKEIKIDNVGYVYPDSNEKVLNRISLKIQVGQAVAFAGPTGAGKTTLANIILGLLEPTEGRIFADNKNIFDNLAGWQKKIGFVPQSIYLLDADIRSNVAFALDDEEIDNSRVWEALKMAKLEKFVKQLPDELFTIIGENGVRLSGGERQRLGIARAVYHQPKILILDEATSSLDNETEREVSRAINELFGQKSLIIIAHRLSTIKQCDCIYFMQKGSIIDFGTFDELVKKNHKFRQMAESGKLEL